jgi:predicted fused transcriptional regulator/phosphomethylpyrimidine kinase
MPESANVRWPDSTIHDAQMKGLAALSVDKNTNHNYAQKKSQSAL